mmetsp:Transcript_3571/g.8138  ORF Transcript_3571/g.8138 Transcript_3571/m.8138 type:complete len:366 (+) Transcript_3571:371-1468(+)
MTWTILGGSIVQLPDGRRFDTETTKGANEFLEGISDNDFFSSKLKAIQIAKTRTNKKKLHLTANDKDRIQKIHSTIESLSNNANLKLFRELIPYSDIRCWLDYVINDMKLMSKKKSWIKTGDLDELDNRVLRSILAMFRNHVVPVALAFEQGNNKFFYVLADLVKARKGNKGRGLPVPRVNSTITGIVVAAMETAVVKFDNPWSPEMLFKKFEATGLLEQFLRCMTVPADADPTACLMHILDSLQRCALFLSKKFKSGEPCGDTLKAIVEGKDGSLVAVPSAIHQRLKTIYSLVKVMDSSQLFKKRRGCKACDHCGKSDQDFQNSYMFCSRCKHTIVKGQIGHFIRTPVNHQQRTNHTQNSAPQW